MKEYYLIFFDEAGIPCNHYSPATSIEESLRNFYLKNRHRKYIVDRIVEHDDMITRPQKVYKITPKQVEEAQMDLGKMYDESQEVRSKELQRTREWISDNFVSSCCSAKIENDRCTDCGEHCGAVAVEE